MRLTRSGLAMRLVHDSGAAANEQPNAASLKLLVKTRRWCARLREGEVDITRLGADEQVSPAYVTRVLRLALLAPRVVDAVLAGKAAAQVDAARLVATGSVAASWREQERALLPSD